MKENFSDLSSPAMYKRLSSLAVNEAGFVFDPQTGQTFSLNQSGIVALSALKEGVSIEAAAKALTDNFEVSLDVASCSVEAFLMQLRRYL